MVDEMATLTAYAPDRKIRERVTQALSVLLTQGRAVGFVVVAAVQDPRKDVIGFRGLFPTRIALRLNDLTQVDMVLGDGAREMGARCDRIPESLPGVGFVKVDGEREPRRVRAAYVTDDDIKAMCALYGTGENRPPLEVVA
jgi:S-DNA-T family DNA segregation ATPase FtsK/SpoIIIE